MERPNDFAYLSDDLRAVVRMQTKYGHKSDEEKHAILRDRGPRFDMPKVGMNAIIAANVLLVVVMSNIRI